MLKKYFFDTDFTDYIIIRLAAKGIFFLILKSYLCVLSAFAVSYRFAMLMVRILLHSGRYLYRKPLESLSHRTLFWPKKKPLAACKGLF